MATFAIHEDEVLKENACVPRLMESKQQIQQQQRKTFGVLNNAQLGSRAHAQKTVIFPINPLKDEYSTHQYREKLETRHHQP